MSENDTPKDETQETPSQSVAEATAAEELEAEPEIPYTVKETKTEQGSVQRYIVEVDRGQFDSKMDDILANLRKTVVIEGFRKGKAPVRLLRNRFGKDAEDDAVKDLAANVVEQIIKKDSLQVIGEPEIFESKVEENQPIQITLDIDVRPTVDPKDYTGLSVEVVAEPVAEDTVDRQLEVIRNANATYEAKEKAFEMGDGVNADIVVTDKDGHRIDGQCHENMFLRDPRQALPPQVAAEFIGKKAGDSIAKTVDQTARNKAGKEVTHVSNFAITVKEVKVKVMPQLDDDFAKDVGAFDNLAALRKRILDDLTEQADRAKRSQAMERLFDQILVSNPFEAPRKIVAAQEYQTIMRDSQRLQRMGVDLSALLQSTEGYLQEARVNSERFVKMNLLISAIAEKEKLEATDADVEKEIERRAEESGRKPLAIRARLEAEKRLDSLKEELRLQKVEDFLMEKNTINTVAPKPAETEEKEEEPKKEKKKKKEDK